VHVTPDDGLTAGDTAVLDTQRALVTSLGGSFRQIPGEDVARALLQFAHAENATQMVLGASRRSRFLTLIAGKSTPTRLARRAEHIDVHLVSREGTDHNGPHRARVLAVPRSRRVRAAQASAEAAALTRLASTVLRGRGDPPALLEEIREMFGLAGVSLLERKPDVSGGWFVVAGAGEYPPEGPGSGIKLLISDDFTLVAHGRAVGAQDMRIVHSCAAEVVAGIIHRRQTEQDGRAAASSAGPRSRAALMAATTQKARELTTAAQAAVARLADPAVRTPEENAALVSSAGLALARVARLVNDASDLSRLHAGALETYLRPVDLDEVIAASLEDLGPGGHHITLETPEDLPDVIADAALLTRILTSLMADALHRSPADAPPVLTAAVSGSNVTIRLTDHGSAPAAGNGSGLAMRLARDLTEAMGDTFRCDQPSAGGRNVAIILPSAVQPALGRHPRRGFTN
jgi:two-component system, OmpR family, sensor histidine kinase KdpD